MHMSGQRIGIIDIGSNSVRLVIYERTESGAHRVVDGAKESARLSNKIDDKGRLSDEGLYELIDTLRHFTILCSHHGIAHIRATATAAIRNAANCHDILHAIKRETGLAIELLSGEEEASYGFLGMVNSLDVSDGYLIDIGGGSTELTLFRNRAIMHSVSLPFGCVSMNKQYDSADGLSDDTLHELEQQVRKSLQGLEWAHTAPELPLIGIGGTVRALAKRHQAAVLYPFSAPHNYTLREDQVNELFQHLRVLPLEDRRKLNGLSKDRADVILPGIAILRVFFDTVQASHYWICGAGLRDGLFHATRFPSRPLLDDPLAYSVENMSALHTEAPRGHVLHVNRLAMEMHAYLAPSCPQLDAISARLLDTASKLYRVGASIDYYDYAKHSFYLIIHAHLNGLSHREIVMTAAIASFRSKGKARNHIAPYRQLIDESDLELICKLGSLLQLAAALDRSETQAIGTIKMNIADGQLLIQPQDYHGHLGLERRETEETASDFRKHWGLVPVLAMPASY
ncbi:Ppx/GppA family phosphatase [Paenibacillus sp. J5C_2022]|uniref:Ppx/GppA family phosphatase n=1 Tax=Paenibacillus sp. J5C2022 TaxID=2977129 RepID=UPI0021D2171A|nr:Ppx/GppA family phosphatase [Paenibacillus sp. J5C2022]MCU6712444.1 Ppx/GppA family phosphatase [Paenibacillus sp. J5C2022]